jgi:glyoxylase-like metal-dependent hydrolase (beta-lactamase superfamily II)
MTLRIDNAVVSGTFSLDGETFDVENNIWVVGDDEQCVVIDAPHDVDAILPLVAGRAVKAILCTHAHDDHVRVAPQLRAVVDAPILLHPDDRPLWDLAHPEQAWDIDLRDGESFEVGGTELEVIHTPGHSPGAVCFRLPALNCVFTGDTLFHGGPGATGRSYSDSSLIDVSVRRRLFTLPPSTVVHTGHGQDTTVGLERDRLLGGNIRRVLASRVPGDERCS